MFVAHDTDYKKSYITVAKSDDVTVYVQYSNWRLVYYKHSKRYILFHISNSILHNAPKYIAVARKRFCKRCKVALKKKTFEKMLTFAKLVSL